MERRTREAWEQVMRRLEPLVRVEVGPSPPDYGDWPAWLPAGVREQLRDAGIGRLYRHQVLASEACRSGRDVALASGTASGKSLAYQLPVLAGGFDPRRPPTVLYLAPTKALGHDQLRSWEALPVPEVRAAVLDGDTPAAERRWIRRHATVVISNPDMVHASLLPNHPRWQSFLSRLRLLVIDEMHVYRGLFGANLSAVVRRLLRVARHYGADPNVFGCSASIADPAGMLLSLTGRPATPVVADSLPRSGVELRLAPPSRAGTIGPTADTLAELVSRGVRTLAFVRSRRAAEAVARIAAERLAPLGLASAVAPYRGGFLSEERRELEQGLREGRYRGVATTSALELGIDVSGLDAIIVAGWPGTAAAFRQRIGRAGRGDRPALALFLADLDPLDAFVAQHPEVLLGSPERLLVDAENPHVLGPHLCAAAAELPISDEEAAASFGPTAPSLLAGLGDTGLLRRRPTGWFWTRHQRAADLVDLRGIGGQPVSVVEEGTGRLIGSVDAGSADRLLHPGAVYTHLGRDYVVSGLDHENGVATVTETDVPYLTTAQSSSQTRLLRQLRSDRWGSVELHFGEVEVATQVVGYLKRDLTTGELLGGFPLQQPVRTLRTKGVWWTIPDSVLSTAGIDPSDVAGAAHAAEHAAIGMLPLFAGCDRWDIGGLSAAAHIDTGTCVILVQDGYPGGAGFAERGFESADQWLEATLEAVRACPCEDGCPACVQSPKCGNGNNPLDKAGAVALMAAMLGHR